MVSTGGLEQAAWSPCISIRRIMPGQVIYGGASTVVQGGDEDPLVLPQLYLMFIFLIAGILSGSATFGIELIMR